MAWQSAGRKTRRSYLTDAQMDAKVRALAIEMIGAQRTEALITVCRSLGDQSDAGVVARAAASA